MQLLLLNTNKTYASLELCAIIVLIVIHNGTKKLRTAWFLLLKHDSCFISMICAKAWKKEWNLEVLREISFLLSSLKQKRWLNRFDLLPFLSSCYATCRIFMVENTKTTQIEIKIQCTVCIQKLPEKQQFRGPKIERKTPQMVKKNQKKKIITDVLKDAKTSLERIWVAHNAFSCNKTISRG